MIRNIITVIILSPCLLFTAGCNSKPGDLSPNEKNKPMKTIAASDDPAIEIRTRSFLKMLNSSGGTPMEQLNPAEARAVLTGAQSSVTVDLSGISVSERSITQYNLTVKLVIVKPEGVPGALPAFLFFHGGGWVIGDYKTHERFIRDLVVESKVAAVYVDYTRSPEAKYPVAINEAYAATQWIAEHGSEVGIDGKRLAVVGNSAGGNIAAAVALMAKDKHGPEIKLQVLFWPVTNADFETESYNQFAEERFLTKNMMKWFWDNYIPDHGARAQPYASPLAATLDQLKGLPPALVQTAENDVLRDEGEAYARKMSEAGVAVTLTRYQGMIHDYGLLNPLSAIAEVQAALRQASAELSHALK
jgi:acetyl esterase/lipase